MPQSFESRNQVWRHYLTDFDEGLGLVYERFVLNDFLDSLRRRFSVASVLEAPLYGMAGVSGINSYTLARAGAQVTLADDTPERLAGVERIWQDELKLPVNLSLISPDGWGSLPYADNSFDLTWCWAALWYIRDPAGLLRELVRCSRRAVFVAMPNPLQLGYWIRKWIIEPEFFVDHDASWTSMSRIRSILEGAGARVIEQGVLDVPPWPDTVMPAGEVLNRMGIRSSRLQERFSGDDWRWSTMDYYTGRSPELREQVMRHAWLDHAPLPWQIKAVWAHHRYLLLQVD